MNAWRIVAPLLGAALVAAHAFAFPVLLDRCSRDALEVRVEAPPAARALSVKADLPARIYDRTTVLIDGEPGSLAGAARLPPGMHRVEWQVTYRGGFERRVGLAQLVGPFQDPDNPPCSARLLVGQAFLDQVAAIARKVVADELRGMSQWPIGSFRQVESLEMSWSDAALGSLVVDVIAEFTGGEVPLQLVLVPRLAGGELTMKAFANADVDLDSRVYQWVADLFDADVIAGATAEQEVQIALRDAFLPPPPVPLPGGRRLHFRYCPHQQIQVARGRHAIVPMQLVIEDTRGDLLPVSFGPVWHPPPVETDAPLSVEFNLDAVNAILYYLWISDFLDQQLAASGIEEQFNTDSAVQDLLSIRVDEIRLPLPPTASLSSDEARTFDLAAEARLTIHDGDTTTPARLFGIIGFDFAGTGDAELVARLTLGDLTLSCEPSPGVLRPCYADLVAELAGRSDELHGQLTRLFTDKFNQIVLGNRIGSDQTMADFVIERAEVETTPVPPTALLRVDLYGQLE